jgi:hypothetical protein
MESHPPSGKTTVIIYPSACHKGVQTSASLLISIVSSGEEKADAKCYRHH